MRKHSVMVSGQRQYQYPSQYSKSYFLSKELSFELLTRGEKIKYFTLSN